MIRSIHFDNDYHFRNYDKHSHSFCQCRRFLSSQQTLEAHLLRNAKTAIHCQPGYGLYALFL